MPKLSSDLFAISHSPQAACDMVAIFVVSVDAQARAHRKSSKASRRWLASAAAAAASGAVPSRDATQRAAGGVCGLCSIKPWGAVAAWVFRWLHALDVWVEQVASSKPAAARLVVAACAPPLIFFFSQDVVSLYSGPALQARTTTTGPTPTSLMLSTLAAFLLGSVEFGAVLHRTSHLEELLCDLL